VEEDVPKVTFVSETEIEAKPKQTVLGASLAANLPHIHACGGQARCSTCRVLIVDGLENCSERTDIELKVSDRLEWPDDIRLACQTRVLGDLTVRRLAIDDVDETNASQEMSNGSAGAIGREQHIVAMFTDVRNYTPFVEQNLPYDVLHVLRRIFAQMGVRVREHGGRINNYMGDGMVALFGLEEGRINPELDAVKAAIAMLNDLDGFKAYFESLYNREIEIGIGIDAGSAVLGLLGTGDDEMFTAIGPPMNKAARIESSTKLCATNLAISDAVYDRIQSSVHIGEIHKMELKGVRGLSTVVEIKGLTEGG